MGQILALAAGTAILNLCYFICGLYDSRITSLARKHPRGYLIDLGRLFVLVGLQILFYIAVNLG